MKIGEIIRSRRKELGLTQEQLASDAGVSAAAVNKWEKGRAYPDITLLPVLARRLGVDINALLSYQSDLTEEEAYAFAAEVSALIEAEGFEAGFLLAQQKIAQYPLSQQLPGIVAGVLDGALFLYQVREREKYEAVIVSYYERAVKSEKPQVAAQAVHMLSAQYRDRGELARAQALLDTLPGPGYDKRPMQASLYWQQGDFGKAAAILENQLLGAAQTAQTALTALSELNRKDGRMEAAREYADRSQQAVSLFDLWEYGGYTAQLELAVAEQDAITARQLLKKLLLSYDEGWQISESPLYPHLSKKPVGSIAFTKLKEQMLRSLREDEEFAFLRKDGGLESLLSGLDSARNTDK